MEFKHLILGTAGHVDHGKTSLIEALTGFNCDTHKEEKERGLTINLGFTHLNLPSGNSVGIIDVPGHADFIKNMISGVSGIDFVLFVISADEGIMPQTIEHFKIMKLLNIKYGLIALTKIDMVDEELQMLAEEEIREFIKDSFLENSPIVPVSAKTKIGIDKLISEIDKIATQVQAKDNSGIFRMYIDRVFTKEGSGTILTGSVLSGKINENSGLYLLPGNTIYRIRKLEKHDKKVEEISAGDRAAINLVGLKKDQIKKGMMLSDKFIKTTKLIDVNLEIFADDFSLKLWSQVIFLSGTIRIIAKIHLLDKDLLNSGESGLAQIYLSEPFNLLIGDKFIIRNSSNEITIGGGEIIDNDPLHHRRRREKDINLLCKVSKGGIADKISLEVRKHNTPISYKLIAGKLNIEEEKILNEIMSDKIENVSVYFDSEPVLFSKEFEGKIKNKIINIITKHHKLEPLSKYGKNFNELLGLFGNKKNEEIKTALKFILKNYENAGKLVKVENSWCLSSHKINLSDIQKNQLEKIKYLLKSSKYSTLNFGEIQSELKISQQELENLIDWLIENNEILRIKTGFFLKDFINEAKEKIVSYLHEYQQIKISDFRNLINSNRKIALSILEYFDEENITLRKEDTRILKKKSN